MKLTKTPVTGMKDILPSEMEIRDYILGILRSTYKSFGFVSMETPCVEHLENLNSKQGGENEKLIFKILKRGEKLNLEEAKEEKDVTEEGLRYDLTVPLCRYYANHANDLPSPFKALQTGNVWRADRPQKGRFRQFRQCDIDILGEASNLAEKELILATASFLGKLDFDTFTIRINDRRLLKAMAAYSGFEEKDFDAVFIILDKMDKIGRDGVLSELIEAGFPQEAGEKFISLFADEAFGAEGIAFLKAMLSGILDEKIADGLKDIIETVEAAKTNEFTVLFDPTLVRGMSYYTGPIFEISMDGYGGSVGGGGRYDEMIGKFTGQAVPACGFSIGFERIVMLLLENGYKVPAGGIKKAYLLDKKLPSDKVREVVARAMRERAEGADISVSIMKKNKKFQKEQLAAEGYEEIEEIFLN